MFKNGGMQKIKWF